MSEQQSENTIVYIGAPEALMLQRALDGTAERIIILDPMPGLAGRIRNQHGAGKLEFVEAAVSASGAHTLYEYSMQNLSSLHQPNRLTRLYPGLKSKASHPISTIAPSELAQRLNLAQGQHHTLCIDAPGEERAIVAQLIQSGVAQAFRQLRITLYRPDMYADDQADIDPSAGLIKAGFKIASAGQSSSLYEVLECTFDVNKARLKYFEAKLTEANEKLEKVRTQAAQSEQEATRNIEQAKQDNSSLRKRLDELEASSAALKSELDGANDRNREQESKVAELGRALQNERDSKAKLAEELREFTEAETVRKQKDQEAKEELEKSRDLAVNKERTLRQDLDKVREENQAISKELSAAKAENSELQASMETLTEKCRQQEDQISELGRLQEEYKEKQQAIVRLEEDLKKSQDGRSGLQKKAEDFEQKIRSLEEQLESVKANNANQAKQLEELEPLKQKFSTAESERSELKDKLATENKALVRAQAVIEDLKQQLKSQSIENEQQVEAEFIKAESQLELIKDILIREKLF